MSARQLTPQIIITKKPAKVPDVKLSAMGTTNISWAKANTKDLVCAEVGRMGFGKLHKKSHSFI